MKCKECHGQNLCTYIIKLPYKATACGDTPLEKPGDKYVAIDKCLLPEILKLWEQGVRTVGNCCGHGEKPPTIWVEQEHFGKQMKELGYQLKKGDKDFVWLAKADLKMRNEELRSPKPRFELEGKG